MEITYDLKRFINELGFKHKKHEDFYSLTEAIKSSYIKKNIKQEEFFLRNIAHMYNKRSNKPLLEASQMATLSRNYNSKINLDIVNNIVNLKNEYLQAELYKSIESFTHSHNTDFLEKKDSIYGYKKLAKVKYIDFQNRDKTPVMLTMTLDMSYRKYIKTQEMILGEYDGLKKCNDLNLEELVEKSYEKLNTVFRDFYRYFKTLNSRTELQKEKLDYIMIFEPHKSLTLHLHVVFYCSNNQLLNLEKSWKRYLNSLSNIQQQGQDYKVIDTQIAKASTYISKYLVKEFNEEKSGASFYNKFRRYFSKYSLLRSSNFYYTTQAKVDKLYSYLKKNYPDILQKIKQSESENSLYFVLEMLEKNGIFKFKMKKEQSTTVDRKLIVDFFKTYKDTKNHTEIKQEILNNLDFFYVQTVQSKIVKAVFKTKPKKMFRVLEKYGIDCSDLQRLKKKKNDIFYREGMYSKDELSLQEAICIANSYKVL